MTAVEAALAGAAVLTSSKRLARALAQEIRHAQRAAGLSAWRTPSVLPFNAFIRKCFDDLLYSGRLSSSPLALNEAQETALWEKVIREEDGDRLLQLNATAVAARDAWELAVSWRVPVSAAAFAVSEDCEAFSRWVSRFSGRCRDAGWLDSARLIDFVRERIAAGDVDLPPRIALAGFDELTPQQHDFVQALRGSSDGARAQLGLFSPPLRAVEECNRRDYDADPMMLQMRDPVHELRSAAEWARSLLERNPRARIGVVVPTLAAVRAKVDRIFGEVLQPGAFADGEMPYHISAGRALAEYPVVHAALLLLSAGAGPLPIAHAGMLLRSAFVAGGIEERDARALVDIELRKLRKPRVSIAELRQTAENCPVLSARLRAFEYELSAMSTARAPSSWSRCFARLLGALGWPGDRTPESREYQTLGAWNEALSTLATLDIVFPSIPYEAALARLQRIADDTVFQPESEGAPIQVLGTLEAAGLTFDHVWIAGLDDETMPKPSRPNPFLPVSIQRQRGMPHCSAERELEFARRTLERLAACAPDVVVSFAEKDGDRELHGSPLVEWRTEDLPHPETVPHGRARTEDTKDEQAPALEQAGVVRGGASLLKAVAACPFQAFAKYRLHARGLEEADFGMSAMEKGGGLHHAMGEVWKELRSHAELRARTPEQLRDLVVRAVADSVPGGDAFASIERERLQSIILHWLQVIEARRPPFTVEASEREEQVRIGGLPLQIRVDRIDRLQDGRLAVIDYKTGVVASRAWEGERPAEPQVPLYAATRGEPLGAVLIAQVSRDEPGYRGIADGESIATKPMRSMTGALPSERAEWIRVLTALADQFRSGDARVDPLRDACNFCDLRAVCRVEEYGRATE